MSGVVLLVCTRVREPEAGQCGALFALRPPVVEEH